MLGTLFSGITVLNRLRGGRFWALITGDASSLPTSVSSSSLVEENFLTDFLAKNDRGIKHHSKIEQTKHSYFIN